MEDRLPDGSAPVLVYVEWAAPPYFDIALFQVKEGHGPFWIDREHRLITGKVTHWQPLPAPPGD